MLSQVLSAKLAAYLVLQGYIKADEILLPGSDPSKMIEHLSRLRTLSQLLRIFPYLFDHRFYHFADDIVDYGLEEALNKSFSGSAYYKDNQSKLAKPWKEYVNAEFLARIREF